MKNSWQKGTALIHVMMRSKLSVLISGLVAVLILLPLSLFFLPSLVGAEGAFIVRSSSMEPEIPLGSMVFVYSEEPADIMPGDVITFYSGVNDEVVRITHRVVERARTEGGYIYLTKGDALTVPDDEWVPEQNVIGEVRYTAPGLGTLVQKYRENVLFIGSLIILSSAIIIENLRTVIIEKLG